MEYFKESEIVEITTLLNSSKKFLAHLGDEKYSVNKEETLKEHTDLVNKYINKIIEAKNLNITFENVERELLAEVSEEGKQVFRNLVINTFNFHDLGKLNPNFQEYKMKNCIGEKADFINIHSKHSILSAVLYINYFIPDIKKLDKVSRDIILEYLFLNAYVISRHHGSLDSFEKFLDKLDKDSGDTAASCIELFSEGEVEYYNGKFTLTFKMLNGMIEVIKKRRKVTDTNNIIYKYIYTKLMFSLLVAADFYATSEFMKGSILNEFGEISSIDEFYKDYKGTGVYHSIREYENTEYSRKKDLLREKNINILRNEMFLDAEKELINNIHENIFFLEAPTGSGKSNVALNLSFKFLESENSLRKIYHVYPFNTLIEQNIKSLENIFGEDSEIIKQKVAVINSITPIKTDEEKLMDDDETGKYEYYTKALLDRQFLNYPMILTTHVSLFDTMFNFTKESAFGFHQLANSVIVLDEIQSYKNIIWSEIITFLKGFAKLLNMKIIIMSATLPDLNILTGNEENTCRLIKDREKFFSNPLFKNRVEVNYNLMEDSIEGIYEHVKDISHNGGKILIEFIKKQSAYEFFKKLKDDDEINCCVELISGDDNAAERKRILDVVKDTSNIILVATQVIEAGVDIDMDIGYKDISKLDSDEQFLGRINRSCKHSGKVYFFNYDDAKNIYRDDVRINKDFSLISEDMKNILTLKTFSEYYEPVLQAIKRKYNEAYNDSNLEQFFNEEVAKLNFQSVAKRMELIGNDMWSMSVYFAQKIESDKFGLLDGRKVWQEYRDLLESNRLDYAKKEIKLSEVRAKMNYFIYSVKKSDILYNDRIGELYYIEDGEQYFENGKIDKGKLTTGIGDFI
ncbi:MAG: CRISPR-associated helicase Cas3' [Clostridium sp.]|nr:CRISPR-associated helicase Cas3' [Clostridium sp.]MDU7083836.1 CRISPR-associated helicase Cas3' [Clostridium sp.]